MDIIQLPIDKKEYFAEENEKAAICLHHTVSAGSANAVKQYFESTPERVGVAFMVEKSGGIFQLFNEKYYSYHIGKGSTTKDNKKIIGIEIINEGILKKKGDKYYWFDGKQLYKDEPFILNEPWRNENYFARYTEAQFISTVELCKYLCNKHNIPRSVLTGYDYKKEYFQFKGILSHHNLRPDKTDVSLAFDLKRFQAELLK